MVKKCGSTVIGKYREIKNRCVVYPMAIGESRSVFVVFCDVFGIILGGVEREA